MNDDVAQRKLGSFSHDLTAPAAGRTGVEPLIARLSSRPPTIAISRIWRSLPCALSVASATISAQAKGRSSHFRNCSL